MDPFRIWQRITADRQCRVLVDVATPYGQIPSAHEETEAVIDTGSPVTIIRSDLAAGLGLEPVAPVQITHAANRDPIDCLVTHVDLTLKGQTRSGRAAAQTFHTNVVIAPPHGRMEPGLLLGLDCFEGGTLTLNCRDWWWEFVLGG